MNEWRYIWRNVRETRRDNEEWTIQRQHFVHKSQDEDKKAKQKTKNKNKTETKNKKTQHNTEN